MLHFALAALLVLVPALPPEHVHEIEEQGHRALLVHSHFHAHGVAHHDTDHESVVDHDDDAVLTVPAVFTVPAARVSIPVPVVLPAAPPQPPLMARTHRAAGYVELLIHGPPRAPASSRAPPLFLA